MTESIGEKFNRAVEFEKDGDHDRAISAYREIIEEREDCKEAYINLGSLYSRIDDLSSAITCYRKALSFGDDFLTYFNLGSIFYRHKKYKKAVLFLEKSRSLNGDFPLSMLVMGLCFTRLRNNRAAESCFMKVLANWPDNRVALTALAILYYDAKAYKKCLKVVDHIIKSDSDNGKIRKLRANALYRLNRLSESSMEFRFIKKTAEEFRRFDDFIQSVPGEIFTDKYGSIDEKIDRVRERARDPKDKNNLIKLSLCHLLRGDTDIALECLIEAKKRLAN